MFEKRWLEKKSEIGPPIFLIFERTRATVASKKRGGTQLLLGERRLSQATTSRRAKKDEEWEPENPWPQNRNLSVGAVATIELHQPPPAAAQII